MVSLNMFPVSCVPWLSGPNYYFVFFAFLYQFVQFAPNASNLSCLLSFSCPVFLFLITKILFFVLFIYYYILLIKLLINYCSLIKLIIYWVIQGIVLSPFEQLQPDEDEEWCNKYNLYYMDVI